MKTLKSFRMILAFLLAILLAVPPVVLAQDSSAAVAKRFSQQELDQILVPVALYPDSLLAQVLMASTYPLEIVMADRWVKQNKNLTGDILIEAADKQPWDPSVKALVPFPALLSTMAEKLEWTEKLGDAFLAQQTDVMETVQSLRKRAYEAGNLKSTNEQHVIVEKETVLVEPADSRVVYVPVYDPRWVYGSWWWPYYPPYVFYPYPYSSARYYSGYIGFSAGFVVGAYWGNWGYCNWPYRTVYVNHHYHGRPYPGYRSAHAGSVVASRLAPPTMQKWRHDPYHRRGVAYRDAAVGNQFGQARRTTADNRRVSRTFEDDMARRTAAAKADAATRSAITSNVGRTIDRSYPLTGRGGRPEASVSRTRPDRAGADRAIGRHPSSAQGGAPSSPAGVNRGATVPTTVNRGRGESVSAPKAQNWNGVMGGQRSAGSAFSRGGAVGAGGSRVGGWSGGGGDAVSRGGTGSHVGGGMGGGRLHRGR